MAERVVGPQPDHLVVRPYLEADHDRARHLWAQLTEHHRVLYEDPTIGGADPGAGLETYLAEPSRAETWVADVAGRVVGLTGLLESGEEVEIEPVVVDSDWRGRGVGRALVQHALEEAGRQGATFVSLRPVARNASAIAAFHSLGFQTLGHVELFRDLRSRPGSWRDGIDLHERRFRF